MLLSRQGTACHKRLIQNVSSLTCLFSSALTSHRYSYRVLHSPVLSGVTANFMVHGHALKYHDLDCVVLSQFLGVWYPIMRLRGSSTPDSAVVRYEITGLGQLMYTVTGQINRSHTLHTRLPIEVHVQL